MSEYFQIELTRGQVARVSEEDFDKLAACKWQAQWMPSTQSFYAVRSGTKVSGKRPQIALHREIMGNPTNLTVDHINGDSLDNRRENLRLATKSENNRNRGISRNNTSGFKGVSWRMRDRKWQACIMVNKKKIYLGLYDTPENAHAAYVAAARKYHGEFARVA